GVRHLVLPESARRPGGNVILIVRASVSCPAATATRRRMDSTRMPTRWNGCWKHGTGYLRVEFGLVCKDPGWLDYPAMMRMTLTSPNVMRERRPEWLSPFNFFFLPLRKYFDDA